MMKPLLLSALAVVLGSAPAAFADIADYMLNINGTTYCAPTTGYFPGLCSSNAGLAAAPGVVSTLQTGFPGASGLGTVTLTFNPGAPGNYFANFWLFEHVNTSNPFDEYGTASGIPATKESWQIDVPDTPTYLGELGTVGAGSIVANTAANTLSDTNYVPGKDSNSDLSSCGYFGGGAADPNCDDATSMALGVGFSLGSGEEEILSFTVSRTAPAVFYLSTTDPTNGTTDYFSATATTVPVGTPAVPEPSSWLLLATACGVFAFLRRRWATR